MSDLQTREQHLLAMENYAAVRARVWLEAPNLVVIPLRPVASPAPTALYRDRYCTPLIVPGPYRAAVGENIVRQMRDVISILSAAYGLTPEDIHGDRRHRDTSIARALCFYVLRSRTDWSSSKIGLMIGKDHATVLHAVRRVKTLIAAGLVCDPIPLLFPGQSPPASSEEPNE